MAVDIQRALTDEAYRATLTAEELAQLPKSGGAADVSDQELENVAGGHKTGIIVGDPHGHKKP